MCVDRVVMQGDETCFQTVFLKSQTVFKFYHKNDDSRYRTFEQFVKRLFGVKEAT